jgi:hypothetical protein
MYGTPAANRTTKRTFTNVKNGRGDTGRGRRLQDIGSDMPGDWWNPGKWQSGAVARQKRDHIRREQREADGVMVQV